MIPPSTLGMQLNVTTTWTISLVCFFLAFIIYKRYTYKRNGDKKNFMLVLVNYGLMMLVLGSRVFFWNNQDMDTILIKIYLSLGAVALVTSMKFISSFIDSKKKNMMMLWGSIGFACVVILAVWLSDYILQATPYGVDFVIQGMLTYFIIINIIALVFTGLFVASLSVHVEEEVKLKPLLVGPCISLFWIFVLLDMFRILYFVTARYMILASVLLIYYGFTHRPKRKPRRLAR